MRFTDMIAFHALATPERPAIVTMERVVTYGMLERGIRSVEERLARSGLARGETAGILVANPIRHLALALALARRAIVSVSLRSDEEAAMPELGLAALFVEPNHLSPSVFRKVLVTDDWFAGSSAEAAAAPPMGDEDTYRIALSSGTTGRPKPVWFTPRRTERRLPGYLFALGGGGWERIVCSLGFSTGWGFHVALTALAYGKTLVCAASARETLQMIGLFRVDCLVASTHQVRTLLECQDENHIPTPSLGLLYIAGSSASRDFFREAQARLCSNVVSCYGSTEVGTIAIAPINRLPDDAGATGFIVPWVEVEAVDESDFPLPRGREGVLRIRTQHQAHFERPTATAGSDDLPWFYPGDRGIVRADGMLIVTGRTSDLINIGGFKISPELVEEVMTRHPAVRDAAVVGSAGRDGLEEIHGIVVRRDAIGEADLIRWCAEMLPKVPVRRIRFVDAIPRTGTGKIVRSAIRGLLNT